MASEGEILRVIAKIYDAALAPDQWPEALAQVAQLCGAHWGLTSLLDGKGPPQTVWFPETDSALRAVFDKHYTGPMTNPALLPLLARPEGDVLLREEVLTNRDWEHTGLYNDIYRPTETYDGLGITLLRSNDYMLLMGLNRHARLGPFEQAQLFALRGVIPHLQRASQVFLKLRASEANASLHSAVWNRLSFGLILLGQQGQILWCNDVAERLVARSDGLSARRGMLSAILPSEAAALRRLVGDAALCANGHGLAPGGMLTIGRTGSRRKLSIHVAPFRSEQSLIASTPSVVVLVNDPELAGPALSERFAQVYGLTPRQAGLTALLAEGCDIKDAADRLAISTTTARSHLREIFVKTDTHRQSELIALFLRSSPPWR